MTLHKSMWKAAVLMGIAGVLMFAGGAWAVPGIPPLTANIPMYYGETGKTIVAADTGLSAAVGDSKTYQWYSTTGTSVPSSGGTAVSGATTNTLDLSGMSPKLPTGTYRYFVRVSGDTVLTSTLATVVVSQAVFDTTNRSTFTNWSVVDSSFQDSANASYRTIVSGSAIPAANLPTLSAAAGYATLGTVTPNYSLDVAGATSRTWSSTLPVNVGVYTVALTTANVSTAYAATTTGTGTTPTTPFVLSNKLKVTPKALPVSAIDPKDTTITFGLAGKYTITGPKLWSGDDGKIDTIVYTASVTHNPVGGYTAVTSKVSIEKVTAKGEKYDLVFALDPGDVAVGTYTVTFAVKGKEKDSPFKNWERTGQTQTITIVPKKITDADVSIAAGKDIVYNGNAQTPERVLVKDGTRNLSTNMNGTWDTTDVNAPSKLGDYTINTTVNTDTSGVIPIAEMTPANRTNAGIGYVYVQGQGNYTGVAKTTFTINKAPLTVSVSNVMRKIYDGTATIDTIAAGDSTVTRGNIKVTFNGRVTPGGGSIETLANITDYIITGAKFDSVNVSAAGTVTASATVSLVSSATNVGRNYVLASGAVSTTAGAQIDIRTPENWHETNWPNGDSLTFSYTIPTNRYFKDAIQAGVNAVTLRTPITNPGGSLRTVYGYGEGKVYYKSATDSVVVTSLMLNGAATFDTTFAPRNTGSYPVKVRVLAGTGGASRNLAVGTYTLGDYVIQPAAVPQILSPSTDTAVSVRQNRYPVLAVAARSPNSGTLSYKWVQINDDNTERDIIGGTSASYTAPTGVSGTTAKYAVYVTNRKPSEQIDGVMKSPVFTVTFGAPATQITGKLDIALASDTLTYTGFGITPMGADLVVRYFTINAETGDTAFTPLTAGTDYTVTYARNTNVGRADIIIVGTGDYEGSATKNFQIVPKALEMFDLTFTASRPYDGKNTGANVQLKDPKTGAGVLTVKFDGSAEEPKLPGLYTIEVSATAGTNFKAAPAPGFWLGIYQITKGKLDSSSFSYTIPTNHVEGVAGTVFGIGKVTFVKGEGFGEITIRYNGNDTVPTRAGTYIVSAEISGGEFYDPDETILGNYTIKTAVSVAESNREVPKSVETNVAAVAPVKVTASGFTAGPSPVSLSKDGEIKFFSAKALKSGTLYIFDASGNAVAKKSVKSGAIAPWNLKDKKGAAVSEGTYVVKGALVGKDGKKEKVSFPFSVVK